MEDISKYASIDLEEHGRSLHRGPGEQKSPGGVQRQTPSGVWGQNTSLAKPQTIS